MKKKAKNISNLNVNVGLSIKDCKQCKEDSKAHEIASHFELFSLNNKLLLKCERDKTNKILVSTKQLNHLIRLGNSSEVMNEYEFEFVDEIDIFEKGD